LRFQVSRKQKYNEKTNNESVTGEKNSRLNIYGTDESFTGSNKNDNNIEKLF